MISDLRTRARDLGLQMIEIDQGDYEGTPYLYVTCPDHTEIEILQFGAPLTKTGFVKAEMYLRGIAFAKKLAKKGFL